MSAELYTTLASIRSGKLHFDDRSGFDRSLTQFDDGLVSVTIATTTEAAQRSLAANRRMWAIFQQIADETGHDRYEVHDLMAARFLSYQVDTVDRTSGEITSVQVTKGTSRLTSKEHAFFMQQVEQWAGEMFGMTFEASA